MYGMCLWVSGVYDMCLCEYDICLCGWGVYDRCLCGWEHVYMSVWLKVVWHVSCVFVVEACMEFVCL